MINILMRSTRGGRKQILLNELGDPRLIAKTIIETDKIAKEKGKSTDNRQ